MEILGFNFNSSIGCIFIGALMSLILYGCTCAQILYFFFHYNKRTEPFTKAIVILVWVLDTVKCVAEGQQMWFYFVQRHAQIFALLKLDNKSMGVEQLSEDVIKIVVQSYFLWKAWCFMLTKGMPMPSVFSVWVQVLYQAWIWQH
ncbi:uncharacterized protein B0H18DRAFT_303782 [Fomitopsis serialis]|uniref:uncharacterized protein n=1 Tax=Fomitopsis serialis TaxID=139415 RepID=UPI002007A51B|nr:uncharacterized protein B0H18DRAFT_303782 [Neoantrodia serialis]KAH9926929.1 hypothetical protein B0H18DRAFT_303782 [Neoantrodia serialis]